MMWSSLVFTNLLSFCVIVPFSSLPAMDANTLLASFAKSRSRTSAGGTGTMAKASLSSFTPDVPIWKMYLLEFIFGGNLISCVLEEGIRNLHATLQASPPPCQWGGWCCGPTCWCTSVSVSHKSSCIPKQRRRKKNQNKAVLLQFKKVKYSILLPFTCTYYFYSKATKTYL